MRKGDTYTLLYALGVCAVCSIVLAVAASGLHSLQERNVELDRKQNVLKAFGKMVPREEVPAVFDSSVTMIDAAQDLENVEEPMPLYLWQEDSVPSGYALPVSGKGLWSTIKGYLALESDLRTIQGITFYQHNETPGLGAEIEKDWFQRQFEGKKIMSNGQLADMEIVKGKVADLYPQGNPHAVDGISGATMTGNGVEDFLNEDLARYNRYFQKLRGGE